MEAVILKIRYYFQFMIYSQRKRPTMVYVYCVQFVQMKMVNDRHYYYDQTCSVIKVVNFTDKQNMTFIAVRPIYFLLISLRIQNSDIQMKSLSTILIFIIIYTDHLFFIINLFISITRKRC